MSGSTFLNAIQADYDEFRQQTLDMLGYARQRQQRQAAEPARPMSH
jgi:hypothetical protein